MGIEIERKFLVKNNSWRSEAVGIKYCQGYLSCKPDATVRVRTEGKKAFLTIKGRSEGISRPEFEYEIPTQEAQELQRLCTIPLIHKTRYHISHEGMIWEVDEFHGENEGLIVAEVELDHPAALITLPPWVGKEVSHDRRYLNSHLAAHPFTQWEKNKDAFTGTVKDKE